MRKTLLKSAVLLAFGTLSLRASVPAYEVAGLFTGALGIGVSEYYKADLVPQEARWKAPPAVDSSVRNGLVWSNTKLAATMSDIMLFGVVPAIAFSAPLATRQDYSRALVTIGEAAVVTGVITQIAKFSVARGRPFAYYSNDYSSPDSKLSFFSGHTSYSFAVSLSAAMLLSDSLPKYSTVIYAIALFIAAVPGYLRIAADKHYFTDVLTGALVGSGVAYGVTRMQLSANSIPNGDERRLQLQKVFVLQ